MSLYRLPCTENRLACTQKSTTDTLFIFDSVACTNGQNWAASNFSATVLKADFDCKSYVLLELEGETYERTAPFAQRNPDCLSTPEHSFRTLQFELKSLALSLALYAVPALYGHPRVYGGK